MKTDDPETGTVPLGHFCGSLETMMSGRGLATSIPPRHCRDLTHRLIQPSEFDKLTNPSCWPEERPEAGLWLFSFGRETEPLAMLCACAPTGFQNAAMIVRHSACGRPQAGA
jgi:hypothetical protein